MHSFAMVLCFACACGLVNRVAANGSEPACLWQLDRGVCAMPSEYWDSQGSTGRDCMVGLNMKLKLRKPSDQCHQLHLENIAFSRDFNGRLDNLDFHGTPVAISKAASLRSVDLNFSAQQIVKRFKLKQPGEIRFEFTPVYDDSDCTSGGKCLLAGDENASELTLKLELDHAPEVSFEVLNATTETSTETILLDSSVDTLVVNAKVLDYDVFISNADAYEYSAINQLDVTISAFPQWSHSSEEDAVGEEELQILESLSGNCEQLAWCEEGNVVNSALPKNRALVQLRLNVPELFSAVQALDIQSRLSKPSYSKLARVDVRIGATATSGKTNPLTATEMFTLAVVLAESSNVKVSDPLGSVDTTNSTSGVVLNNLVANSNSRLNLHNLLRRKRRSASDEVSRSSRTDYAQVVSSTATSANVTDKSSMLECSWRLDRSDCALPSKNQTINGAVTDCLIGLNMIIKLSESFAHKCQDWKLEKIQIIKGLSNTRNWNISFEKNYSHTTHSLHYAMQARMTEIIEIFKLFKLPSTVQFRHKPEPNNSLDCPVSNQTCVFGEKTDDLVLNLREDGAPKVSFEVINVTSVGSKESSTVNLALNRSVDSLLLIANVQDDDVFINNTDAYEYSAISEVTVNISAVVQFFNNSREEDAAGDAGSVEFHVDKRSGNCKYVAWCEKGDLADPALPKNRAQKQLRLSVPDLYLTIQALDAELSLSILSNESNPAYARIVYTIEATATSGTTNPLTSGKRFTLTIYLANPLEKPPTPGLTRLKLFREKFEDFAHMLVSVSGYLTDYFASAGQMIKKILNKFYV